MGEFDSIRPYQDDEVAAVLARLTSDKTLLGMLTRFRFPRLAGPFGWLLRPLIAWRLRRECAGPCGELCGAEKDHHLRASNRNTPQNQRTNARR